jgi:oligopeptidase B
MTQPPVAPIHPFEHNEHGVRRPDPYAWLKDKQSSETLAYVRAERAYYDEQMAPLAHSVEVLAKEMTSRVPETEETARWPDGGWEYFKRVPAGQEHPQLCRTQGGEETVLLDHNALRGDSSYVEVGVALVSPNTNVLAYSVDVTGDEVYQLRFRDLTTGEDLADRVAHTYYGGAWAADSENFFYVVHDDIYRPYQVWRHRLGQDAAGDELVFEDRDPQFHVNCWADRAGQLIIIASTSCNTSESWLVDATKPEGEPWVVTPRRRGIEYSVAHLEVPAFGGNDRGSLLIVSNDGAEEFRLMQAPLDTSERRQWREVIKESTSTRLHAVDVFARHVVLTTVSEARQVLRVVPREQVLNWSADGSSIEDAMPIDSGIETALLQLSHNEEADVDEVLVEVESLIHPVRWQRVNLDSGERTEVKVRELPNFSTDDYVVEQRWVTARDGKSIPVKIARHRTTALDGRSPMLLYGYGSYESAFWPGFDGSLPSLLDRGIVFAHAQIRGGGDMGRKWYLDGRLLHKMNTFTDFIDVADGLASAGLVDGTRIVSRGLSAGGLLQGAVFSLRPDRWRAVVAEVPFVDVVTTMFDHSVPLTAGETDEWGDPRDEIEFHYMLSYSPYDNPPEERRPELLATGALHDPRVMIHEPAKWVAKLRATAQEGDGRTLFRAELGEGGHTGPTGRYAHLAYEAEVAAFIANAVGNLTN